MPFLSFPLYSLLEPAGSGQVFLRHPERTIYRCFLSDLADFIAFCRAGPSLQHYLMQTVLQIKDLKQEINPAGADCRYRAPLVPRLAQPQSHAILYTCVCQETLRSCVSSVPQSMKITSPDLYLRSVSCATDRRVQLVFCQVQLVKVTCFQYPIPRIVGCNSPECRVHPLWRVLSVSYTTDRRVQLSFCELPDNQFTAFSILYHGSSGATWMAFCKSWRAVIFQYPIPRIVGCTKFEIVVESKIEMSFQYPIPRIVGCNKRSAGGAAVGGVTFSILYHGSSGAT